MSRPRTTAAPAPPASDALREEPGASAVDRAEPLAHGSGDDGDRAGGAPLVETDLLVEEVSIDGMCGVY